MYDSQYEFIATLQYRIKSLQTQYLQMEAEYKSLLHTEESRIHKLEAELSRAHAQTIDVRNKWWDTIEDIYKDHQKELAAKDIRIKGLEKRALNAERQRDELLDKKRDLLHELYEVKTELEDMKEKNQHLKAQLNRDYENSSKPSVCKP